MQGKEENSEEIELSEEVIEEEGVKVDGRAPKYMTYNATYHTTKLRLVFRHAAGYKHKMHMVFELFKA